MYANNLDDAFSAFALGTTDEWIKSDRYMMYPEYRDEEYTYIEGRTIGDITAQISVQGEAYSQYISFMIDRYYDGIDLVGMSIWIHYELKNGSGSEDSPVNVMYNDSTIRFGWVIPDKATQQSGDIKIGVWVNGTAPNTKAYILKTEEKIYTIHPGLIPGSGITQPDQTWFENFVEQMDSKVSTAQGHANDAQASKTAAAGSATAAAESAAASAKALEDNRAYVESQKETFVGYNRRETDTKYANALVGSASGTGRVTVGDAWEAPVVNMDVAGKSEQFSTTGAQLLDLSSVNKSAGGAVVNYGGGGYSISGTGALTDSFTASQILDIKNALQPGNLILKSELTIPKLYVRIWDGNTVLAEMQGNSTKQITQEMIDNDNVRVECFLYGNTGSTITPGTYHPMLYQSGDGTWEPYTGGNPSPSPDYPQPIISTGTVTTGAQLLVYPFYNTTKTQNGITFTALDDGRVSIKGTVTGNNATYILQQNLILPPGTYTKNNLGTIKYMISRYLNGAFDRVEVSQNDVTFDTDGWDYDVYEYKPLLQTVTVGDTFNNLIVSPMLSAGATPKPWEPYTGGKPSPSEEYPQPLDVTVTGAQLLDMTQAKGGTNGGITIVINDDGSYTCTGTATESTINIWFLGKYIEEAPTLFILEKGTYYKSGIRLFNGRKTIGPIFDGEFTLAEDTPITGVRALQLEAGKTYSNYTVYPMINAGPTAQPWQPYQSCTATISLTEPLRGIGDVRDRIMCKDGVWGIERMIGIVDNDAWKQNNMQSGTAGNRFLYTAEDIKKVQPITVYCTKYTQRNVESYNISGDYIATDETHANNRINIRTLEKDFETVDAFKVFMADAMTIYPLATPTWEPLPSATQSALNALTTYTGTTHVTVTAGGPEPDVGLEYVQDTRAVIAELKKLIEGMQNAKS